MKIEPQCDMMRPRRIIERLNSEGVGGLTEFTLYKLLKSGAIPARKPGRCYLVSYAAVLNYLQCTDGGDIAQPPRMADKPTIRCYTNGGTDGKARIRESCN